MTSTVPRADLRTELSALFSPRGIAVVGASRKPGKLGGSLARSPAGFAERGGHLALVDGRDATVHPSGGVNHALMFLLTEAGHGIGLAVGIGNGVDVSAPDVLDHLVSDPDTGAVALHVESLDGLVALDAVVLARPTV